MKRIIKVLLAILIILFIGIQFIPPMINQSNKPPVNDIATVYPMAENIKTIFKRSCYDCHSNNTAYPWYAHIQPMRYILDSHVAGGKGDLNFNEFGTYTSRQKKNKLRGIVNSLTEGTMPLSSYTFIHHDARLSHLDTAAILNWINKINNNELQ